MGRWENDRYAFTDDGRGPQVRATATVRGQITGQFPGPPWRPAGHGLTLDAQHSVRWLVDWINSAAYPIVAKLRGEAIR
ncbi:hypothetical protein ACIRQF_30855 [Streptomyces sp. NPDC101191]|uniref:hypothetical protein n=1 Tax=Streptomyces sp. NPDC101191 TaxID=3366126 RepID=UPI003822ADF3